MFRFSLLLAVVAACQANAALFERKNILHISVEEQQQFIKAINLLKEEKNASGWRTYDNYVLIHSDNTQFAHMGPAFFPWHRQFLLDFENDLRRVSGAPELTIPYWDWLDNSTRMDIWTPTLMGGNGTGPNSFVTDGPFAHWTTVTRDGLFSSDPLQRAWGTPIVNSPMHMHMNNTAAPLLPEQSDLIRSMMMDQYDTPPYNESSHDPPVFRNSFEGWELAGCFLHNAVHIWTGGQMRTVAIAPNDPVFWMHHAFVDKMWALWQSLHTDLPYGGYLPVTGARKGHNLYDVMVPFSVRPVDMLSIEQLGYSYEDQDFAETLVRKLVQQQ